MIVLAVDPGFGRLGLAVMTKQQGREKLLFSTCLVTSAKLPFPERLKIIIQETEKLIKRFKPSHLVLEKLYFAKNKITALKVAEVRGIFLGLAAQRGLVVSEYAPTEIKYAVAGYGRANKIQIKTMVEKLVNLDPRRRYDDEIDAIAVGLTHLATTR